MANILLTEKQLEIITNNILDGKNTPKQSVNEGVIETALMAFGFVPVIGEIADIALICYYLYRGEKLYAALMLIALIPTVGDFIVKPFIKLLRGSKAGVRAMKAGAETTTEFLKKNPENLKKIEKISELTKEPVVQKTVEGISKFNSNLGSMLKSGLDMITKIPILGGIKSGIKSAASGGKFSKGLKSFYQKQGISSETGVKKWWSNVKARKDRRDSFRRFIIANNLLATFGLPSLKAFEDKIENDPEFRKNAIEDEKMSEYIKTNSETENTNTTQNSTDSDDKSKSENKQNDPSLIITNLLNLLKT